jgi:3-methyladenine DNA glycosylase AlkD
VEAWVRGAHGWAYVDPLAGDIAGPIALVHPDAWPLIDAWATDEDFWIRRSALLTLLPGIRRGGLDHERFERYATPMLTEREFFIRKAIGWVLREAAKKDPAYVAAWSRPPRCRPHTAVVKDTLQRSFRENSATPDRYLPICLTYR